MSIPDAVRGDVWLADLDEGRGREQSGIRPVLVVSATEVGTGRGELAVVLPLTTTHRPEQPLHVEVVTPEGGTRHTSYVMTEQIRSISRGRLLEHWGSVSHATMGRVEYRLRTLLDLL